MLQILVDLVLLLQKHKCCRVSNCSVTINIEKNVIYFKSSSKITDEEQ